MRALVVYESMFGDTKQIAEAVADGLRTELAVELVEASKAPAPLDELVDLVVVGGPTHAFSMPRQNTREEAVRQGAKAVSADAGIREWIEHLHKGPHSERVATFDTRVTKARRMPGSAAKAAAKGLRKQGYSTFQKPESFWVEDVAGPLVEGEVERARRWGEQLAAAVARRVDAR
ncbi:MAG TPA: flavodoxin domain-containing protein [Nocardioidaceae bacterium]|nr:flavodoxin domain-containing protein [Nocardioidaceae bacterium]